MSSKSTHGPGRVLFAFVRHWSRRSPAGDDAVAEQGRHVLVAEAVGALTGRGIAASVNAVAHEIGIDQSGASRLIKSATEAGYLSMEPSQADGRRREASLTSAGRSMLKQARHWQEQVFDQLAAGWSEQRRRDFQHAMEDLIDRSYELDTSTTPARR
ncbi:MarR family winged helix-turn-helix transcriptional regulator [Streptomyces marispadix]|uniref:MarR family winged helix-turn-helix transcriptional regulator n=1 Tax=Streptomyces marispadix TaxID=2922868 RepID=A0ABS9T406_9ACTN|nr:MarR family winged helix-turn-helix transcriptional regulator [Streptomyces marispadix]MCH6163255.1 MarR family winged helix-turn-helix transcriptional regulator [Streptomyces marispadix]